MARRKRRNKDAIIDGLMGAAIGGLQFKLGEMARKQMEEADLRKEQRLAAIRAGETEAAQQFQLQRDERGFQQQTQLTDKQIQAQLERDKLQDAQRLREIQLQGENQMRVAGAQGANSLAVAREGRPNEMQTFQDDQGNYVRIPLNEQGQQQLNALQSSGRKLRLMEGSRGGRFSELDGGFGAGGGGTNGAGSMAPKPAAPNFVWDPEQQRLVPAGQ